MATTKISKVNNFLKVEITGKQTTYKNAAWYEVENYDNDSITLRYLGSERQDLLNIQFADFQDASGTPISNINDIINYLSEMIG